MRHSIPKPTRGGNEYDFLRQHRELTLRQALQPSGNAFMAAQEFGTFSEPIRKAPRGSTGFAVQRMRIWNHTAAVQAGDYIMCRTWDGTTDSGDVINVAKPWLLRRTTLHEQTRGGESYTHEADGQSRTVTHLTLDDQESDEVLYPTYRPLDEIIAFKPEGGTGVALAPLWQDMNVDARTFVHPYRFTTVCVGGVDKTIIVRRGDVF